MFHPQQQKQENTGQVLVHIQFDHSEGTFKAFLSPPLQTGEKQVKSFNLPPTEKRR